MGYHRFLQTQVVGRALSGRRDVSGCSSPARGEKV